VGDKDFRRELNAEFDQMSGSPSPTLRDRVRSAVGEAPAARGPYWLAAVAAAVMAALIVGVLYVNNPLRRSPSTAGPVASPAATPAASPTPPTPATPQPQLPPFTCSQQDVGFKEASPPPTQPPVAFITAMRTGTHGTYDRVTIEFGNGLPHDVQVSGPGATTFTASPSGMSVTVKGQHGLLVVAHGADLHSSYSGSVDIVTSYGTLVEVRRIEDFEGVVQLALGVNGSGCYRAFWLTNPYRLVIDVQAAT
jgi:hypothetical protein